MSDGMIFFAGEPPRDRSVFAKVYGGRSDHEKLGMLLSYHPGESGFLLRLLAEFFRRYKSPSQFDAPEKFLEALRQMCRETEAEGAFYYQSHASVYWSVLGRFSVGVLEGPTLRFVSRSGQPDSGRLSGREGSVLFALPESGVPRAVRAGLAEQLSLACEPWAAGSIRTVRGMGSLAMVASFKEAPVSEPVPGEERDHRVTKRWKPDLRAVVLLALAAAALVGLILLVKGLAR